MKQHEILKRF